MDAPDADDPALRTIPFRAPIERVMTVVAAAITAESRTRVVARSRHYVRAEARSMLFRFVDDVELLADPTTGLIHFRSASRVGRGDLGVNRRRMRRITTRICAALSEMTSPVP